jgi:phosphoglycolate phosphatase-like HAD superfamily hydrolase
MGGRHQLILFDIDGTLVHTGGAGGKAMSRAFAETCRVENGFDGVPLAGRTDPLILADALARCGLSPDAERLEAFQATYFRLLADELERMPGSARVLPGVESLLAALTSRPATTIALLTGNYSTAARLKLTRFGLWSYFPFGAFGEDAGRREGLVAVAVERGRTRGMPEVAARDIVVIGDTPLDVACGRANGARTIAVATGGTPAAALAGAGADLVLDDLGDGARALDFLDRSPGPSTPAR